MSRCSYRLCGHLPTLSGWIGHDFSGHRTLSGFMKMVELGPLVEEMMQPESVYIQLLAESSMDHLALARDVGKKHVHLLVDARQKARGLVVSFTERPLTFCYHPGVVCNNVYGTCEHKKEN